MDRSNTRYTLLLLLLLLLLVKSTMRYNPMLVDLYFPFSFLFFFFLFSSPPFFSLSAMPLIYR
ncbi:uncharacterized protein GGS25DRAFT_499720 [Hypoxylon fragiforme]|uniref:uncharacterized protein n=1 Tax=Hypoxylon fragiforme TaxID=63214 RepID=UPI0020C6FE15|nr:uncharacterized protein GGS25DRAFT_499720 [Hypoxylon fragiforme]KAI2606139.1 hypothetical protein GGS25DRAFT_499720 [Hypoxylon fragiforme]